jgi:hypothetical protein
MPCGERFERFAVAKEAGDADEQIVMECLSLPGSAAQDLRVLRQPIGSLQDHPTQDSAPERTSFVIREVDAGFTANDLQDVREVSIFVNRRQRRALQCAWRLADAHELGADFPRCEHDVHEPVGDGAVRHARLPCAVARTPSVPSVAVPDETTPIA